MKHMWARRAGAAISLISLGLGMAQAQTQTAPVAHLAVGDLLGVVQGGVTQFRGIPYAQAPVGSLRWAAPQPAKAWGGQRDATQFGAACPQVPEPFGDTLNNSEDCLFLNVFVPPDAGAGKRPVIVWIPGSGQVLGSARQYDASRLAQATQAVVVTMNYRLGALGWLWTSGMAAEAKGHNFALQDQQEALRWVKRHIGAFNGDSSRVTMAGESVGSISASLHLVSPTAAGLFDRAILASGIEPPGLLSSAKAAELGDAFAARLGCAAGPGQLACLRAKSPQELLKISPTYADIGREGLGWKHFIDGEMITTDVFAALSKGAFNKVPVMVGSTRDEGRGFIPISYDLDGSPMTQDEYVLATQKFIGSFMQPVLTGLMYPSGKLGGPAPAYSQMVTDGWFACQVNEVAHRASTHVPTYAYEFADRTAPEYVHDPFMASGAFHAADLLYWFQTPVGGAPLSLNPAQKRLSDQMQAYWKQFAETGNPNGAAGTVNWPKFNKLSTPYLTLVPDATDVQDWGAFQRAHQCGTWSLLYGMRSLGAV